ncbi:putative KHDC1-like protein [Nannospalax galili]|uniref:putative KHDC1-like protein n=1 Tax=Nannospalax galili TaxID=1026970 RepID=UPI0004ED2B27|nr:putative KHDC1-like protein [Nannospalax galili]
MDPNSALLTVDDQDRKSLIAWCTGEEVVGTPGYNSSTGVILEHCSQQHLQCIQPCVTGSSAKVRMDFPGRKALPHILRLLSWTGPVLKKAGIQEMEVNAPSEMEWRTLPENFHAPLVFYMDESLEEHIFGHRDTHLRCIEVHSYTLIQLEGWFTGSGLTRVTVVGPLRSKQWLMDMIWSVGSQEVHHQARGQAMLHQVRNHPLTTADLDASLRVQSYCWGLSPANPWEHRI